MHLRLVGVHHELYVPAPRAYGRTRGAEYLRLRRSERESRALIRSLAAQAGPVGPAFSRSAPWHTYALALTLARARQRRDSPLARDSLSLSACAACVWICVYGRALLIYERRSDAAAVLFLSAELRYSGLRAHSCVFKRTRLATSRFTHYVFS